MVYLFVRDVLLWLSAWTVRVLFCCEVITDNSYSCKMGRWRLA